MEFIIVTPDGATVQCGSLDEASTRAGLRASKHPDPTGEFKIYALARTIRPRRDVVTVDHIELAALHDAIVVQS